MTVAINIMFKDGRAAYQNQEAIKFSNDNSFFCVDEGEGSVTYFPIHDIRMVSTKIDKAVKKSRGGKK